MFGFVLGSACLAGLIFMLKHGGCAGHAGWHHRWGGRGFGAGVGPRAMLRGLFTRLDTSPGQEKVIVGAVEELMQTGRQAHKQARAAREALADAMRSDTASMGAARAGAQTAFDTMSQAAERAFATVHEALDEKQRRVLADLIEEGPGHFGPWAGHPYRCAH